MRKEIQGIFDIFTLSLSWGFDILQMNDKNKRQIKIPEIHQEQITFDSNLQLRRKVHKKNAGFWPGRKRLFVIIIIGLVIIVFLTKESNVIDNFTAQQNLGQAKQVKQNMTSQQMIKENIYMNTTIHQRNESLIIFGQKSQQQRITRINKSLLQDEYTNRVSRDPHLLSFLKRRISIYQNHLSPLAKMDQSTLSLSLKESNITNHQFRRGVELITYAPLILSNNQKMSNLIQQQFDYFNNKYNISSYKQLPFCLIVPSYQNQVKYRNFMNLYTILQQNYDNYHVVIIDDASKDRNLQMLQNQLKRSEYARSKVKLVSNKKRENHMSNIYSAAYNYCQTGQIMAVIDGDDQLVGKQVLKLINAFYQQKRALSVYSNHIQSKRDASLQIGISSQYPSDVLRNNSFREARHHYSHIRTAWTDLFYQIKEESLKNSKGQFYDNAVDNAIFLSIFEMSCGQVHYLPEITYRYNTYTGNSISNMHYDYRRATAQQISKKQRYKCINITRPDIYAKIEGYFNSLF